MMIDRAELQIVVEIFERGLDLDQTDVGPPPFRRYPVAQVRAQQISSFAKVHLAQLVAAIDDTP